MTTPKIQTLRLARLVTALFAFTLTLLFILPASATHAAATSMFSASPSQIVLGEKVTITWDSQVNFACVGTNFNTGGATSGTVVVQPTSTGVKTYAIDCSSPGARFAEKDVVTVNSAPPPSGLSATITASPTTVTKGDATLVSWSSSGATTCRGTNFSTNGATKGSVSVTPEKNTTYTVTCDGAVTTSSSPGTWQSAGTDYTDLWCSQQGKKYSNVYTENECPSDAPTGQSCTGSEFCAVSHWRTAGGGVGGGPILYCTLVSEVYRCNGGSESTPNQATDSVTVSVNRPPNAPVITGPVLGKTNTEYTFSFRASDPDQDKIRYRIDWDNNGSAEDILPASGHVNSNTLLNALRSWFGPPGSDDTGGLRREATDLEGDIASAGAYTFRAKTQDSHGALSGWASHTITISDDGQPGKEPPGDDPPTPPGTPPGGGPGGPGGPGSGEPLLRTSECSDGEDNNGNKLIDLKDPACESGSDDDEGLPPPAELSLSVSRLLVASGSPVTLTWSAKNVRAGSCNISGTNPVDSWGPYSAGGGVLVSSPLTTEVDFTLSCVDYSGETLFEALTVRLAPRYREQ